MFPPVDSPFPPVEAADEDGLLAIGGQIEPATLRAAYRGGIFPWPIRGLPPLWFAPPQRAVLFLDEFHISRRLKRDLNHAAWQMRVDSAFEDVIRACGARVKGRRQTWITRDIIAAYSQLHREGVTHCVEAWDEETLAGGLYGVSMGAYFAGESMFFRQRGASKAALCFLVEHLRARGATWLDCQMMTPLFESFGAREVPREEFMAMLDDALHSPVKLFD